MALGAESAVKFIAAVIVRVPESEAAQALGNNFLGARLFNGNVLSAETIDFPYEI